MMYRLVNFTQKNKNRMKHIPVRDLRGLGLAIQEVELQYKCQNQITNGHPIETGSQ